MEIRAAIQKTIPALHGLFSKSLANAEAADDIDRSDFIFDQANDKAESLVDVVDGAFENDWAAADLKDEILEWLTETPEAGVRLDSLKRGDFFRRKADASKTYTRGAYQRDVKKYQCDDESDISRSIDLPGKTLVHVGFDY